MVYSDIKFERKNDKFIHNIDADYACFALWEVARPYQEDIKHILSDKFEIIAEFEINWSDKFFNENASRLYEVPINLNAIKHEWQSNHAKKIGKPSFILFVVKDIAPNYTYAMSVSKKIELSNLNIVSVKYKIRDLIEKDTGVKYGIHSTNNIFEFFYQIPLLLGVDRFKKIINGQLIEETIINKDLEGAGGWNSYEEMFEILNTSSNYLVQRGFENLPLDNPEKDIDFLTDNFQRLCSLLGIYQNTVKPYKGVVSINNENIDIDVRYIGDKYYDTSWQKNMLNDKIKYNNIFIPRDDDYFFSLLYHSKVQKFEVKPKYVPILTKLSKKLDFKWFEESMLVDDKIVGNILSGYFQSQGYFYENSIDKGVIKNTNVIKYLPINMTFNNKMSIKSKIKKNIKRIIPKSIIQKIKK